ncbi:DUF3800 domain-containing protein [Oceanihabitans sediminis]|uniref:DUF3800 domain-containing protein n=1 Tax=Oceanihabitans sediminis TaxID=1812012 RepID=UPI003A902799
MEYNIYCDESCHLPNDSNGYMVLGGIWCLKEKKKEIFKRLREIKVQHGLSEDFEVKWNKVSPGKQGFYMNLVDYFFDDDDLHFRGLVVDKSILDHKKHGQTHDDFYYKMYFDLLKVILEPSNSYNIYIDIKDTQGQEKVDTLKKILRNSHYDYDKKIVKRVQQIKSHEVELLPLADLIIGAIGYLHRGLNTNSAKLAIIKRIQQRSGYNLFNSTLYRESKLNLFIWKPRIS